MGIVSSTARAKEFLSVRDVAATLGCSVAAVRKWLRSGKLRGLRAGRLVRISRSDLESFLQEVREVRVRE
jgi:excisionase family DNA binding protein